MRPKKMLRIRLAPDTLLEPPPALLETPVWSEFTVPLHDVLRALAYELVASGKDKLVFRKEHPRTPFSIFGQVFQTTIELVPFDPKQDSPDED